MVDLTREEFQVLWQVEEGNESPEGIVSFLEFSIGDVERALLLLHKYKLIDLQKKEEGWNAKITEKARELYAQYEHWIP